MRERPGRSGGAGEDQHSADQQPRAPAHSAAVARSRSFRCRLVAQPRGEGQKRVVVGCVGDLDLLPAGAARLAAAALIAAIAIGRALGLDAARQSAARRAANGSATTVSVQLARDRGGGRSASSDRPARGDRLPRICDAMRSSPHKMEQAQVGSIEPSSARHRHRRCRDVETGLARRLRGRLADRVDRQAAQARSSCSPPQAHGVGAGQQQRVEPAGVGRLPVQRLDREQRDGDGVEAHARAPARRSRSRPARGAGRATALIRRRTASGSNSGACSSISRASCRGRLVVAAVEHGALLDHLAAVLAENLRAHAQVAVLEHGEAPRPANAQVPPSARVKARSAITQAISDLVVDAWSARSGSRCRRCGIRCRSPPGPAPAA